MKYNKLYYLLSIFKLNQQKLLIIKISNSIVDVMYYKPYYVTQIIFKIILFKYTIIIISI